MGKRDLKDMTLQELWELFPIVLEHHNPDWIRWGKEIISELQTLLEDYSTVITHIGSTAIPGIHAKPIIDILIEISPDVAWDAVTVIMENNGFICMSTSDRRLSFNRGYTPDGYEEKVYHVHFHHFGDNKEIVFRDYLINNPEAAKEYERLKLSLIPRYKNNRDAYTEAKTGFINNILHLAESSI